MGAAVAEQVEQQGDQRRASALTEQASGTQHPAGATATMARSRGDNSVVIRRLKQPETGAAQRHTPDNIQIGRRLGQQRQAEQAAGHNQQPNGPQQSRMAFLNQITGQRRHHHGRQRPRRQQQAGLHFAAPHHRLQEEGQGDHRQHLRTEGADGGADRE